VQKVLLHSEHEAVERGSEVLIPLNYGHSEMVSWLERKASRL
jgi:hypothetical protein